MANTKTQKRKKKVVRESASMFRLELTHELALEFQKLVASDPKLHVLGVLRRDDDRYGANMSVYLSVGEPVDIRKVRPPIAADIDCFGISVRAICSKDKYLPLIDHVVDACHACEPWPGYFSRDGYVPIEMSGSSTIN